jgi:DNA-binding CsgD family transcriptional regulator
MPGVGGTDLTRRELEILALVIQGYTNREIAERCSVSDRTIDTHVYKILRKTGCRSRTELALKESAGAVLEMLPASVAPVRITVDLSPELYRRLTDYTIATGREMGIVKLAQAEVIRALIRVTDNDLVSGAVRAIIGNNQGTGNVRAIR